MNTTHQTLREDANKIHADLREGIRQVFDALFPDLANKVLDMPVDIITGILFGKLAVQQKDFEARVEGIAKAVEDIRTFHKYSIDTESGQKSAYQQIVRNSAIDDAALIIRSSVEGKV